MCRSTRSICESSSTTRIFFFSLIFRYRQVEYEPGTFFAGLDPDLSAVALDDPADDREAHAESSARPVGSVKSFEHRFAFRFRNAGAFILDGETHARPRPRGGHLYSAAC